MNEKQLAIKKLKTISNILQNEIAGIQKCIEETQPIAKGLGFRLKPNGELIKIN